jgi:DNA-binding protein H-NS
MRFKKTSDTDLKGTGFMDERKRDSMIAYLRHRMDDFGISPDDLASELAATSEAGRYRSANGDSWSGEGAMPQWLKHAISAGQSIGHFELSTGSVSRPSLQAGADWTNDPFAGSPLARSSTP